ncbi:LmbE-like protein [Trametes coccinea BRFM310]|uniref:N-acetylglucosaminylphosphatidylinositol deacetylase n=1 Tax=Trametes coccinea (strain BRFM310) TaxID=1353009 RepID=A0A1Y2ILH5_TRAC3|nr:LmbE-like protein [Trametes coccinea BRFM310]
MNPPKSNPLNMFALEKQWLLLIVLSIVWSSLAGGAQNDLEGLARTSADEPTNILLLTAHPDDECMFFAPTILALLDTTAMLRRPKMHSLCLSVGNADGLGEVRRHELARSLEVLGIEDGRRWVIDRPDLQDNFTAEWQPEVISDVLRPYVLEHDIDIILTFDEHGVSSHPNHVSLPKGAAHLLSTLPGASTKPRPRLFSLITVPLHEKYLGPVVPISTKLALSIAQLWHRRPRDAEKTDAEVATTGTGTQARVPVAVSGLAGYARALRAMMQHRSQLVWFRWLYVSFLRYMWVNEWVEYV